MAAVVGNASGDAQSTAPGYADALQRAREIASKIQPENPGPMGDYSNNKRPLEDVGEPSDEPGAKKLASQNDVDQSLLGIMQQQQQQLGAGMAGGPVADNILLPDKLVGLIIGKGGENITKLQAQTGCRIQIAQECAENNERPCTLTGTPEQIATCRATLLEVIKNANAAGINNVAGIEEMSGNGAQTVIQLMIPPDKCGLIIGKGGDTIKSLQQNIGVKMMLIQDTTQNTGLNKPLRISGDPMKVQRAKEAVEQLMAQRDAQIAASRQGGGGGGGGGSGMGGMNRNFDQQQGGGGGGMNAPNRVSIPVPKPAVGVVIGKGGEMITRLQNETQTRVQFKQEEEDPNIQHRMCTVSGTPEGVQEAVRRINELVQSVREHDNTGGRTSVGRSFGQWDGPGMGSGRSGPGMNTVEYQVPANKTGLVIGKGGETIKNINHQSRAHVEILRNPPPGSDPNFKTFIIKGSPDQIAHAQQLIQEKVDGGPGNSMRQNNMGPPGMGPPGGHMQGPPGTGPPGGYGPPPQGAFGGPPPGPGFGGPPQAPPAPVQPPQAFPGQQPWAAPGQFQWPGAPGAAQPNGAAPPDPHKPADPNAAATWASFYQYYQSQGQQPAQAAASASAAAAAYPPAAAQQGAAPAVQPDYTKAWEEYYKKQAEAAAAAAAVVTGNPAATAVAPAAAPQAASSQADYSAAWAEYYRQYSQYYQQTGQYPTASGAGQ